MSSAMKIIQQALRLIGVAASGETLPASEANEGLDALNQMLDQWSNEGYMVYHVSNTLYPVLANVSTYNIGPGSTWDTSPINRPLVIQKWGSFVRQTLPNGLTNDYQLEFWPSETYQSVFLKNQTTNYPSRFTYISSFPVAQIILWPMPVLNLQFSLASLDQFYRYALSDQFELPAGYEGALAFNLAIDLAPQYGVEVPVAVAKKAQDYKNNIMLVNMEQVIMRTEKSLSRNQRSTFNIYSGA